MEMSPVRDALGWGAQVASAEVELGYNYVGLEERVSWGEISWEELLPLVEGVCGCCSQANLLAYTQAVESLAHLIVPPRAAFLRLVLAETERILSHLLNVAWTVGQTGMADAEAAIRDLRERVIYAFAEWIGSRAGPSLITYGGLSRNIDDVSSGAYAAALRPLERSLREIVTSLVNNREVAQRQAGMGTITGEEVIIAGLRGPVARASGVALDMRALFPTGAYEDEGVTIVTQRNGDAFSRLVVRLLECLESFRIIDQALDDLPPGAIKGRSTVELREASGIGRAEGPRGEVFCWVRGGANGPHALHISGGSAPTVGVLPGIIRGTRLDDLRLLLLSLDLCLSSVER
jgi:Ni,Fe-hydrogenase III large subunit